MAKEKKLKVPKRIAGVKVPKKLRKTAKKALAVADRPVAMELAVAALTAAAAALRERNRDDARQAEALRDGVESVREQAMKLSDVVIAAALDGARRLLDGIEARPARSGAVGSADAPADAPVPPKRRRGANGRRAAAAEPPRDA